MERAPSVSLRWLVTALAVVLAVAAVWAAAALADGSGDAGSTAPDGASADLVQNVPEDDGPAPFDEDEDFFRGGDGLFGDEDCPFGERGFGDREDDGGGEEPGDEPGADADADL